jgi:Contractile injection system tube protein
MPNPAALSSLQSATKTLDIYAQLIDIKDSVVWKFLYNPEEIRDSYGAKYQEAPTALTSLPAQQYLYSSAITRTFPNLLLQSYCEGKSLRQALDDLKALTVADVAEGEYAPRVVYFTWGSERFGACVITEVQYTVTAWLNGEPADLRLDLTLLQVPNPVDGKFSRGSDLALPPPPTSTGTTAPVADSASTSTTVISLTDRQRQDGRLAATRYLQANISAFTPQVQEAIRSRRYLLAVGGSGQVTLGATGGDDFGLVGVYDGRSLSVQRSSIIRRGSGGSR